MSAPATKTIPVPFLPQAAQWIHFDNGHSLVWVPKSGDVFNVSTWVKTGSIHEDDVLTGISHFLEHLMFKGSKRFEPGVFDREMEGMGGIINAATWKDFTFYYITGPKGAADSNNPLGDNFKKALDMHADMLLHSTLPVAEIGEPGDISRERGVVIEEIGMREDQPWTKVYNTLNELMYPPEHPYRRDVIGTRDNIRNVPRAVIEDYYHQWYSAKTMVTIVVGDFPVEALTQAVRQCFDFENAPCAQRNAAPLETLDWQLPADAPRQSVFPGDYQTTFFMLGWHGPSPKNLKESIALDVATHALSDARSSRLTQALLEKPETPLFNTVSAGQSTFKLGNTYYLQGNFDHTNWEERLHLVKETVQDFLTSNPLQPIEFERALKSLKTSFADTSETASGIADAIGESVTLTGDLSHYTQYLDTLLSLDVDTVRAVAQRYLDPSLAFTCVMLPQAQ